MSIHTAGTLAPTPDDFQTTHQGVPIMVKCIDWGNNGMPVIGLVEKKAGGWEVINLLMEFDDVVTPEKSTAAAGGTAAWIKTVLLPRLNAALAVRFKAGGTVTPPAGGSLADIDKQIGVLLRWAPQTDGTLKVTAV